MLLHVSVNKPSFGSLLPCFTKVMIIKIFKKSKGTRSHSYKVDQKGDHRKKVLRNLPL
jgi:hypothetical protein